MARLHHHPAALRRAMTLIELLVVIVILSLLLVTVIPILSPNDDQKGREAAVTAAGMVSRVLGRAQTNGDRGAGLWIEPAIKEGAVRIVLGNVYVADDTGQPLAMAGIDLFTSEPQNNYCGDDPEQALVHVNTNRRTESGFVDSRLDTMNGGTDAVLTFSVTTSPFVRELCSKSTRIRIPKNSANEYYLRLFTQSEQSDLLANQATQGYRFPRPYRKCNDCFPPGAISPPGGVGRDWQDPDRNPQPPPPYVGQQTNDYYDQTDGDRINLSTDSFVSGMIRRIPGNASLPIEPALFDPGARAVPGVGGFPEIPARNYPGVDVGEPYAIVRPNTRSTTPPLSLPAGFAIDVAWSCYGTTLLRNSLHQFPNGVNPTDGTLGMTLIPDLLANEPIQIMFDKDGRVTSVQFRKYLLGFGVGSGSVVDETLALTSDLYLLVGRADRVGLAYNAAPTDQNPGANWQYADSRWIKISRTTGRTLIADPMLYQQQGSTMVTSTTVYQSQGFARDDVPASRN